ncbi:hypothetical protein GCM10010339_29310 [Streptomyces alanosinicus]|uniref:Integral membrane protein n=1 Tax=Streptomyces alanosinicus TaxID=68171 RepID=A0A918YGI6_9ACTN|nr:hypothetical protein GCM10010339_29310 [Streptomyces alanosinicus]
MSHDPEPDTDGSAPAMPGFWYGRRLVARLRAAHTAVALLTVAAAVAAPAARFDHRPGGPAALDILSRLLTAALPAWAAAAVGAVCRRGRSEDRLDQELDRHLVRGLPLGALTLLLLTLVYAGWARPGWRSTGRLPGDPAFGALMPAQGLLVVALAVVARDRHRRSPDPRAGMRGLSGPAVALLACALGGVMSGGVAQRVADWLDGTRALLPGPPVLLTWQASAIPPVLAALLPLAVGLGCAPPGWPAPNASGSATNIPANPRTRAVPTPSPRSARWPPSPTGSRSSSPCSPPPPWCSAPGRWPVRSPRGGLPPRPPAAATTRYRPSPRPRRHWVRGWSASASYSS